MYICTICGSPTKSPKHCDLCGWVKTEIIPETTKEKPHIIQQQADLNIISLLLNNCGYSIALEQLSLGLKDLGFKVNLISHEERRIEYQWMTKEFREMVMTKYQPADKTLVFTPPIFMKKHHIRGEAYAYSMFETEKLGSMQVERLNMFKEIIVTCEHSAGVFRKSGVMPKISIAPLCIDYDKYKIKTNKHKDFVFMSYGTQSVRKGSDILVLAFLTAFPKNPKVRLIIKDTLASKFKYKPTDNRIIRIEKNYSEQELLDLIASSDCGVFPSRGEGWGLGAMESMSAGLPVILTDYGGLAAMCNSKYNYPLKVARLVPSVSYYIQHSSLFYDIGDWAEPDLNHLIKLMKDVYKNKSKAMKKGKLAAKWIKKKFNRIKQARIVAKAMNLKTTSSKLKVIKYPW